MDIKVFEEKLSEISWRKDLEPEQKERIQCRGSYSDRVTEWILFLLNDNLITDFQTWHTDDNKIGVYKAFLPFLPITL